MSSDCTLFVIDSRGVVRIGRWLGENYVADWLRLMRAPDESPRSGLESWFVTPDDVKLLEPVFQYVDSPTHDEIVRWIARYSTPQYTWKIERDF